MSHPCTSLLAVIKGLACETYSLDIDGQLHGSPLMLIAALEDGSGVLYLGRRQAHTSRFSGTYANIPSAHLYTAYFLKNFAILILQYFSPQLLRYTIGSVWIVYGRKD